MMSPVLLITVLGFGEPPLKIPPKSPLFKSAVAPNAKSGSIGSGMIVGKPWPVFAFTGVT
jgi:hypothetical protein